MRAALDVHRELLERDLPHEIVRLRRTVLRAEEIPDVLGLPAWACVAVRLYVVSARGQSDRLVAVAAPAGLVPDPGKLLAVLDACSLRTADAEQVHAATDVSAALMPPVGLPADIELIMDSALARADVVYTATGESGTALGIRFHDLLRATGAPVADLTAAPTGPAPDEQTGPADVVNVELAHLLREPPG